MKKIAKGLTLFCSFALVGTAAHAGYVTLDAGTYSQGSDVSHAGRGATLSTYTNAGTGGVRFDPVKVLGNPFGTDVAPNAFGHADLLGPVDADWNFHNVREGAEPCLQGGTCDSRFYALHLAFAAPTDFVSVSAHYNQGAYDGSLLRAFDSLGNSVGTCRVWGSGSTRDPQSGLTPNAASPACGTIDRRYGCSGSNCAGDYTAFISVPNANIAYVLWGSVYSDSTWSTISSLSYNSVPEPAPLALLGFGCVLAFLMRRKPAALSAA